MLRVSMGTWLVREEGGRLHIPRRGRNLRGGGKSGMTLLLRTIGLMSGLPGGVDAAWVETDGEAIARTALP
jgi:hypothetical protein